MINTLTYEEAVEKCPSIAVTEPASRVSKKYNFISTGELVHKALENDWVIREAKSGRGLHGMHQVNLIHKSQTHINYQEGFPQLSIVNSHNLTRKFSLNLGFFRLVCSNGLIAPTGLCTSIRPTLHRQGVFNHGEILTSMTHALDQFETVVKHTEKLKNRELSESERLMLARYAYYIRFRYRMSQPKKVDIGELLRPRREADNKTDLWTTFNVIQENIMRGGSLIGKGVTQFQDELRFNQELWTGVDKALDNQEQELKQSLDDLFPKKERIKKNLIVGDN